MENVISECAPTSMHIIFINQWWQSFCFHGFWQSICSILRDSVSKEFAGKQNFARRCWKNTFFQPAKCCHCQLLSHYKQIMCESSTQAPPTLLFCLEKAHRGILHIFQALFLSSLSILMSFKSVRKKKKKKKSKQWYQVLTPNLLPLLN